MSLLARASASETLPEARIPRAATVATIAFILLLAGLWAFPSAWYTRRDPSGRYLWLSERTSIPGWQYRAVPVDSSAERLLAADRILSGEFRKADGAEVVRVFSAKRYEEKSHDVGLFVHTPDRCWTESGWGVEPASPDNVELTVHGTKVVFERRIFVRKGQRELVYFGGLVGGQALPYRLDHNLSVGMRHAVAGGSEHTTGALRASDKRFWARVWDSFLSRRPLLGPKQFLRVSTSCAAGDAARADALLQGFLATWLTPADFAQEYATWRSTGR